MLTIRLHTHGVGEKFWGLRFRGRDLTNQAIRGEVVVNGARKVWHGWVTHGLEGRVSLAMPTDIAASLQGDIWRGQLIGTLPNGSEYPLATLVINGLEQP